MDSSGSEQACAGCAISIAVDKNGDNCGVEFLQPGLMQPDEILRCIEVSCALCTVHCVLYTVYCVMYTVCCVLCIVHCVLCAVGIHFIMSLETST